MRRVAVAAVALGLGVAPLMHATVAHAQNSATTPGSTAPPAHVDALSQATVEVLVGESRRARGVVLRDDGRIVTALGPLGTDRTFRIRYPNRRVEGATLVASDPRWGIALLQPSGGSWPQGIPMATRVRGNTPAQWMMGIDRPTAMLGTLRRRRTFVAVDGELLRDAWELAPAALDGSLGSGVASNVGELLTLIVPPPQGGPPGSATVPFGVPLDAIRTMVESAGDTSRPWLGMTVRPPSQTERLPDNVSGALRVTTVAPEGPAARAGLRGGAQGDWILRVGDREVRVPADLATALEGLHPNDAVVMRILRDGAQLDVSVELGRAPALSPRPVP